MKKYPLSALLLFNIICAVDAPTPMAGPVIAESTEQINKKINKSVTIQAFAQNKDRLVVAGTIEEDKDKIFIALFKNDILDQSFGSPVKNGVVLAYIGENPMVKSIQLNNQIIVTGLVDLPQKDKSGRMVQKTFLFTLTYSLGGTRKKRAFRLINTISAK